MPEIEGVNLTCGRYDRNEGDLKGPVYEQHVCKKKSNYSIHLAIDVHC